MVCSNYPTIQNQPFLAHGERNLDTQQILEEEKRAALRAPMGQLRSVELVVDRRRCTFLVDLGAAVSLLRAGVAHDSRIVTIEELPPGNIYS